MAKKRIDYLFEPPDLSSIPRSSRKKALQDIADYIKEEMLLKISKQESPVNKGPWIIPLSDKYAAIKKKETGSKRVDLELSGDLLSSIVVKPKGSGIQVTVDSDQQGKADGNNRGTYGKREKTDNFKARRFVPIGNETFDDEILSGVQKIIDDYSEEA